jgi:ribonuclease G
VGKRTRRISVDDANTFSRIQDYLRTYIPKYQEKLYLYSGQSPIFESYAIEGEIGRALEPRVQLKSGGSLVLEQTEALVSIDVNTSGFVAGANLQETVFKTNLEAAQTIPSQLRLRNLGGIIVIDFIDMATTENREKVLQTLKEGLARDPNKTFCDNFSELGLVLMSRKRTRKSLQQTICQPCDVCSGTGLVMSAETTCMEIVREIFANDANSEESDASGSEYLVTTTNAVIDRFLGEDANFMAQISATLNCRIRLQYDPAFMPGQFDIRTPKQTPV